MKSQKNNYFKVVTAENGGIPEILIYGIIGQERWWEEDKSASITDIEFVKTLRKLEEKHDKIHLRINSPGGSMFHGNAIISAIISSKAEITGYNDGLAASMAADIWIACHKREMPDHTILMVHSALGFTLGNAKDHRNSADILDKYSSTMLGITAKCLGWEKDKVKDTFYDYEDHYMTADEAKEFGFITKVAEYNAKAPVDKVEKMSYQEILKQFTEKGDEEAQGWMTKIFNRLINKGIQKHIISNASKNSEMNINEFKTSLEDNSLSIEDVQKVLQEKGFVVSKNETAPAAAKTTEEVKTTDLAGAIEAAIKPLTEKIAVLQGKIDKLEAGPGAGVTKGKSAGDDFPPAPEEEEDELDKFNKAMAEAAKNHHPAPIQ